MLTSNEELREEWIKECNERQVFQDNVNIQGMADFWLTQRDEDLERVREEIAKLPYGTNGEGKKWYMEKDINKLLEILTIEDHGTE